MVGRALAILVLIVVIGAGIGVYLIKQTPTAKSDEDQVRELIYAFGAQLQNVSVLADRTIVADSMREHYAPYVTPALLSSWQNNPLSAVGRVTSSPWPQRIEITRIERDGGQFEVQAEIIEVTNEDGGIDEEPTVAARYPITITLTNPGSGYRIAGLTQHAYPGDGHWVQSEITPQGLQFKYPEPLSATFVSAAQWPPRVEVLSHEYSCKETTELASDGPTTTLKKIVIEDREYCRAHFNEGAAGSMYTSYEYTSKFGDSAIRVFFTLRFPQCMNYPDPNRGACAAEQSSFDVDGLADRISQSIRRIQ